MKSPIPSVPAGTVMQVVQAGYMIRRSRCCGGPGRGLQRWREGGSAGQRAEQRGLISVK